MFLSHSNKKAYIACKTQQGSSLVMAIFIIIVMSVIGATLMRMNSTSANSLAFEVLGTRAHMAARAGIEYRLKNLFPLEALPQHCDGTSTLATADTFTSNSNEANPLPSMSNSNGLVNCQVSEVSCQDFKNDGVTYYTVTSTGQCDISGEKTSRTIQVEARNL